MAFRSPSEWATFCLVCRVFARCASPGFSNSTTIAGKPLNSLGSLDIFLAKLDPMGNLLWAKSIGDENLQMVGDVAVHPASGQIAITGSTMKTVDFGNGPRMANGRAVYVAKFYP